MSNLVIEDGVPLPDRGFKTSPFPFRQMSVGQSVFIPQASVVAARTAAAYASKDGSRKFVTRKADREGEEGLRIWRSA